MSRRAGMPIEVGGAVLGRRVIAGVIMFNQVCAS